MIGLIALSACLVLSVGLNVLLLVLYTQQQRDWLQMFRKRESLETPEDEILAQDADVVRTAKDLVSKHQQRRRKPAFSIPVPGTEWMRRTKEQ